MHSWIFVTGESDIPQLAGLASFDQGGVGAVFSKDAVWIFKANNLVMLDQIDAIDLQTFERFIQLFHRFLLGAAVDLGHHKCPGTIAVAKRLAHASLTGALIIIPAVIQKVDAAIDGRAHNANRQLLIDVTQSKVPAAHAKRRDFLARAAQSSINHLVTLPSKSSVSTCEQLLYLRSLKSPFSRMLKKGFPFPRKQ